MCKALRTSLMCALSLFGGLASAATTSDSKLGLELTAAASRGARSEVIRLVEAGAPVTNDKTPIELILAGGDRLRIPPGIDAATLRMVLSVLRERA